MIFVNQSQECSATCIHDTNYQIMKGITTTTDYSHDMNLNGLKIVRSGQSYNTQHLFSNN